MIYNIYTDGACSGNPGPGGWAFVVTVDGEKTYDNCGNDAHTTNNRMELMAFLEALKWCDKQHISLAHFYVDSAYIYNCFKEKWYVGWIKNNWKNASKKPVANKDLWEQIFNIYNKLEQSIEINKVAGHSGNTWNEYTDKLAVKSSQGVKK